MLSAYCTNLKNILDNLSSVNEVAALKEQLQQCISCNDLHALISCYHQAIPVIEKQLWQQGMTGDLLDAYHQVFQELEALIYMQGSDERHEFVVVIPVADRPQHLQDCLQSLFILCERYQYGGKHNNDYAKVSALIADDSREMDNIRQHKQMASRFTEQGLPVIYFGIEQQLAQLDKMTPDGRKQLKNIIGENAAAAFYHKGASITRNITYLKLRELADEKCRPLFFFVDSDQEFQVKVSDGRTERNIYAVNYFYYLDQIFSRQDVTLLTGKVVGDPPVSPSVMAGNFLEDITAYLHQVSRLTAEGNCVFHGDIHQADDASYHDMAELFGFKSASAAFEYHCELMGKHDHIACFNAFAGKINHFFDGEHPTRKTYYQYEDVMSNVKAARTVYTGNYVISPEAIDYFIPFAMLKLRMAGPTLGRILKSRIGARFVSANLPMLHKRTVETMGRSEFRPGIEHHADLVDLSGEFERQYFGDVMLFTMEQQAQRGFPRQPVAQQELQDMVQSIDHMLYEKYQQKNCILELK